MMLIGFLDWPLRKLKSIGIPIDTMTFAVRVAVSVGLWAALACGLALLVRRLKR